jgi:curved DNA-binding protein
MLYWTFSMTDHYATLGVARTAAADEIKRAFRRLASQHHPDKGGDTARFQEIQVAYDTLSDPNKRAAYDNPSPFQGGGGGFHPAGVDINDLFSMFRQGGFTGGFPGGAQPRRSHVRMSVTIQLRDVALGSTRRVSIGSSAGTTTVEISVPRGIQDGDNVQYSGVAPGGQDLVVQFRVQPDPVWRRDGLNLHTDFRISIWKLIMGGDVDLSDFLGNQLTINLPAGSQPGTVMRLRQRGLQDSGTGRGDLMLRLTAYIPDHVPDAVTQAIKEHCQ